MRIRETTISGVLLILIIGCSAPSSSNKLPTSNIPTSIESPGELLLPRFDKPLPFAEQVSFAEAQARVPYEIPSPAGAKVQEVWVSPTTVDLANRSVAIRFSNGLLLIIHPMPQPPDWQSIITTAPLFESIMVNGNPGMGIQPGTVEVRGKSHFHPGSVEWWMDGLDVTLYSNSMSLEALLGIAESLR